MELQNWQRSYLDALIQSDQDRIVQYETVPYFSSIAHEQENGVQELLLHRVIAGLKNYRDALDLLEVLSSGTWTAYEPRVLARITNTDDAVAERPELEAYFDTLRQRTGYTTYSVKDWKIIGDGTNLKYKQSPAWAENVMSIESIVPENDLSEFRVEHLATVLKYLQESDFRLFQVCLFSLVAAENEWAIVLHRILLAPYIDIGPEPLEMDSQIIATPNSFWSPHWMITPKRPNGSRWHVVEAHTGQQLDGLGISSIFNQIGVLLALSGLLRDGIQLNPFEDDLIRALKPSHPIWGFRRREFSAARTNYQADDIRALALGFLEPLSATHRVSIFRSRLAIHLAGQRWRHRHSASIITAQHGFYSEVVRAATLLGQNRFNELIVYVQESRFRSEPVFRFFLNEAATAVRIFERIDRLSTARKHQGLARKHILCVAHASLPEQTGGYAIRAHGVLTALRDHGINITAVTRPGFPDGSLTESRTVMVENVPYSRLPATDLTRQHGEIQYLESFIEPFKTLFREQNASIIHVRSTFLIALPALIAAKELGLKVLYEVSGLWELVYKDREEAGDLLKRSAFAELAETITMTKADQLVVMNEAVRQIALDRGVSADRIHIAHNAVNVDAFQPLEPPENNTFTLGYLGSFQDYEGLEDLIGAVRLLTSTGMELHVVMVGDGPQFNPIRSRVVSEGLEEFFTFKGRVPHNEVIGYYATMDVLVYPRRSTGATQTITPLKPFEALALAKPIIVSNVMPLQEIVGQNERGLIFESGNVEELARCIRLAQERPEMLSTLGQAGRNWVEKHRNWDRVVDAFMNAYQELVDL